MCKVNSWVQENMKLISKKDSLLKDIYTYKDRYKYYDEKGNKEKADEYLSLLLNKIGELQIADCTLMMMQVV